MQANEEQNEQRMKEKIEASVLNERFIDSLVEKVVPKVVTALMGAIERVKTTSVGSKSSTTELDELHSISGPTDCELMLPYGTRRPIFAKVTCNKQLDNWECGYYVMCWIHEFVLFRQHNFTQNNWKDNTPFSSKQLEERVNSWVNSFGPKYLRQLINW
ncbi:hypothetical protein LXL04_033822 [Taraxacum kok-saghyz]